METTKIAWADATFNPWHGCIKISESCKFCYAETLDNRWNGNHWGPDSPRKPMSEKYWKEPLKWEVAAEKANVKTKVFCASMADVFEDHKDVLDFRLRLFELIDKTPNLIWMLLTKRPENIMRFIKAAHLMADSDTRVFKMLDRWINGDPPHNVWIGTSVENQQRAIERIPVLCEVPARVRFLSMEPLLSEVDITANSIGYVAHKNYQQSHIGVDWVIVGGESGNNSGIRPMNPEWVRNIYKQCKIVNIPFFFKQWGIFIPTDQGVPKTEKKLNIHEFDGFNSYKLSKEEAGHLLDGKEMQEFPNDQYHGCTHMHYGDCYIMERLPEGKAKIVTAYSKQKYIIDLRHTDD